MSNEILYYFREFWQKTKPAKLIFHFWNKNSISPAEEWEQFTQINYTLMFFSISRHFSEFTPHHDLQFCIALGKSNRQRISVDETKTRAKITQLAFLKGNTNGNHRHSSKNRSKPNLNHYESKFKLKMKNKEKKIPHK